MSLESNLYEKSIKILTDLISFKTISGKNNSPLIDYCDEILKKNEKARKPSLIVEVDFGKELGIKQSSAQITHYYNAENLVGKQVIGVCNFPEKNIAGVKSQVLILGSIDNEGRVTLVHPSQVAENGLPIA